MFEDELGDEELALMECEEFDFDEICQVCEEMDITEDAAKKVLRANMKEQMSKSSKRLALCV